jgi:hypothetical protein
VQAKGIGNIFNSAITEYLPNIEKEMVIQVQEAFKNPNEQDQDRTFLHHIIVKILSI